MPRLEEEVHEGGILPTYSTWIFALGFVAVASSVLLVAVLPFLKNRIASAYILALLASCNLMVMHVLVHALSPARLGQDEFTKTGMGWNEAFFWRSLFCLVFCLPYYCSPSFFSSLSLAPDSFYKEDDPEERGNEATPLQATIDRRTSSPNLFADCVKDNEPFLCLRSKEWMLMLRGFLGVLAGIFIFVGVSYLPPSEAVALYATAPFWSILFSSLILGDRDKLSGITVICMVACFSGVMMILEPWEYVADPTRWCPTGGCAAGLLLLAGALSLLAGALVGVVGPLIRTLPNTHVLELVLWLGIVGVVTTGTIAVFFDSTWWFAMTMRSAPISAVAFVMVMGMTSLVGQICLNLAWQAESAPPVTMEYLSLVPTIGVAVVFVAGVGVVLSRLLLW